MALAAAWFETEPEGAGGERALWEAEGEALRWLEVRGDPELSVPVIDRSTERSHVAVYVPVNDRAGPASATLQSCPSMTRSRQPRTFPLIWVGHEPVFMIWPEAEGAERHRDALDRLCRKVTRIGHSSSLVAMWVANEQGQRSEASLHPVEGSLFATHQVRSLAAGTLAMLRERFGKEPRRLSEGIRGLELRRKAVRGKGASEARASIDATIQALKAQLGDAIPRPPVRPTIGLWTGYRPDQLPIVNGIHSQFDHDILVLTQVDGPKLPLTAAMLVTKALRDTIMSKGPQPVPEWVSGHQSSGQPSTNHDGHLAIVPLPLVGYEHADGHLLGVGLVFPKSVPLSERGRVLGRLLVTERRRPEDVKLELGHLGVWVIRKRDWEEDRRTLAPVTWTAASTGDRTKSGSRFWASVTPVVLDRFPRAERRDPGQRAAWEEEVRDTVKVACTRIGLPEPELVDVDTTSWHPGCPRAVVKRRPLRGQPDASRHTDTALGDGFPPYPARGTNAPRPQVHVWLQFPEPVIGPVLLGAGRYLGYGFCKPWEPKRI
jgi:CRISPR-associated protein Csb2